jgi:hypothetical protein
MPDPSRTVSFSFNESREKHRDFPDNRPDVTYG